MITDIGKAGKRKRDGPRTELVELINLLEEKADEREEKMMKLFDEMEAKRREKEMEHEINMTRVFVIYAPCT